MKPVIGILANRENRSFKESNFLRDLILEGEKLGAKVYAFAHFDLNEKDRKIRGFVPGESGGWVMQSCPWPDLVIDFCRKLYKPFRDMRRRKDLFPYANHKFTYKWKAMKLFAASEEVKRWIPETSLYSQNLLLEMLRKHPIVYIKPGNGTAGHSIVKINANGGKYKVYGRKKSGNLAAKEISSEELLVKWLDHWVRTEQIRSGKFMIQQGLDLKLLPGRLVDCRLLIQKDGMGKWTVTGKVLRVGGKNSPTTNLLYGDGKALQFNEFLVERFGAKKAAEISKECDEMAVRLMNVIEKSFGSMIEFGLDVGIDVKGRIWLIEANPKPSHKAFLESKEFNTYKKSIRLPIQYAMYLIARMPRNKDDNEFSNTGAANERAAEEMLS